MFSIWIASRELLGLCFCSGYCVCGAKYWKLWYRIPWCMLTLAAAKGFWGCFSCALLRLHCPPPTISSGRGVPCSHCSLSWGGGSTGKTLWCISGWKLISNVSEVFRENTSMWELFLKGHLLLLNSASSFLKPSVLSLRLQEAASHLQNISSPYSMYGAWTSQPAISASCPGISKYSDYCGTEDQGKAHLASLWAAQDESWLDGNVSWGPHRRKGRVSKQAVEQISHTYCLLLSSVFTCAYAYTVPLIPSNPVL